jgi:putative DNA primase/helicase
LNGKTKRELGKKYPGLDIRADGGYVLFSGQTEKGEYHWLRDPTPHPLSLLPEELRAALGLLHPPQPKPQQLKPSTQQHRADWHVEAERLIRMALERAPGEGRNNAGFWLAVQLRDNAFDFASAHTAMLDYRSRVPDVNTKGQPEAYTEEEVMATLREVFRQPAREPWSTGSGKPAARSHPNADPAPRPASSQPEPFPRINLVTGYQPEDVGNAERLIRAYGNDLRYCHDFNKWVVWDGKRWAIDADDRTLELTKHVMLEFGLQAVRANSEAMQRFAAGCRRAARLTNAMRLAQPELRITPNELNAQKDLLNCSNGVVNLRTGAIMSHAREFFMTKLVHHVYRPEAQCPQFMHFLAEITANHPGLIDYLQKAFGYSLTAHTSEKAVFLLNGRGKNGKTTLLSAIFGIISEYAACLQVESLMIHYRESANSQADLADLHGARFVMTSETEEGQRLAEGRLKRISQGMGVIRAVRKYENPFTFHETHKLWIDANHLPIVRGTDDAIWSRFRTLPFDVVIAKEDPELPSKLAEEAEGILAWAISGAVKWYSDRLGKLPDIDQVGAAWRRESDQVTRFLEDCCVEGATFEVRARALYLAYKQWAEEASEKVETEVVFANRMAYQGFSKIDRDVGIVYKGIGLKH